MSAYKGFLNRLFLSKESTLGVLTVYYGLTEVFRCCTLELPWLDNQKQISCIPAGEYEVTHRAPTPKFGYDHYLVNDVRDRDGILFHRGNYTKEIRGCILPGTDWKDLNKDGKTDIANSTITLQRLYETLGNKPWLLVVSG